MFLQFVLEDCVYVD